jgi:23S rRNA (adenine2503-C2)-methyltransferase
MPFAATTERLKPARNNRLVSCDGTVKLSFALGDGQCETCLLELNYREIPLVLCVSTQLGCPFDCQFCAVGLAPFQRPLSKGEILDEILCSRQDSWWKSKTPSAYEVAAMGTGEPMLALSELIKAVTDAKEIDPALVSLNVATVGIPERIREYAHQTIEGVKLHLQLSLHASSQQQRDVIMPAAHRFHLPDVIQASLHFARLKQVRVVVNYILISGVNDSEEDAKRLVDLFDPEYFTVKVSLLNRVPQSPLRPTTARKLKEFTESLKKNGLSARIFVSAGVDVGAGCGQFSNSLVAKVS